jgi:hypothetical protein
MVKAGGNIAGEKTKQPTPTISVVISETNKFIRFTYKINDFEKPAFTSQYICKAYDQSFPGMYFVRLLVFTMAMLFIKVIFCSDNALIVRNQQYVVRTYVITIAKNDAMRKNIPIFILKDWMITQFSLNSR